MTHEKITFVLSTNLTELSHTVKQCYGSEFDGDGYLEKFFSEIYILPQLSKYQLEKIDALDSFSSIQDRVLQEFILEYSLPLRITLKISNKITQS